MRTFKFIKQITFYSAILSLKYKTEVKEFLNKKIRRQNLVQRKNTKEYFNVKEEDKLLHLNNLFILFLYNLLIIFSLTNRLRKSSLINTESYLKL